jgi:predicted TIM-barrel fold metal-dependent hydrolase
VVVDTHLHLVADDLVKYPAGPIGGQAAAWALAGPHTVEKFLAEMAEAGVDQAALVQASLFHGYDNSYTADSAARYPDKFVGVCCIDPLAEDAIEKLDFWVTERGMRGLRLFTVGSVLEAERWLDDPRTFPTWERAGELGIAIDAQVRVDGFDMLRNVLDRFRRVKVILDHLGRPKLDDGPPYAGLTELLAFARYGNLYLKCTGHNICDASAGASTPRDFLTTLIKAFGVERIIWGSNLPAPIGEPATPVPYKERVAMLRQAVSFLPERELDLITGENARNLYPNLKKKA